MSKEYYEEIDPDEDIYAEGEIDLLLEDDEISTVEEAFMRGYIEE
ncbi:MAG: hypothetical protein AABY07_04115 [Nanoarchaeota archaeon]